MFYLAHDTAHVCLLQRASPICVLSELSVLVMYEQCQMMFTPEG